MQRSQARKLILKQAKIVRESLIAAKGDSQGWCYEACGALQKRLRLLGIKVKLVEGRVRVLRGQYMRFHYWLEYDRKILDITGDQFNCDLIAEIAIPDIVFAPYKAHPEYKKDGTESPPAVIWDSWAVEIVEKLGVKNGH